MSEGWPIGTPGLGGAISLFRQIGTQSVENRILGLTDHICNEVATRGYTVQTPRDGHQRSGIVIFSKTGNDLQHLHDRLTAVGVKCAVRAGGIRFSPHVYNTLDEIDTAIAVLD